MARWQDIQEYARKTYTLFEDEKDFFSVYWKLDDGRSQRIVVTHFSGYDKEWIDFRSWVCAADAMRPQVALQKNDSFIVGHLALDDTGDYVMRHAAPLDTIDLEEFDLPLHVLALSADKMEQTYAGEDRF